MSGRCKRVYVRLTPGEKDLALDFASRNDLTVSLLVRVLIQLPADCTMEGAHTSVVLDRASAGRLEREMRRWGNHYNQAVHALNRIVYYAERGSLRTDEAQRMLNVSAGNLEDLNIAVMQLREETHNLCSHAIVSVWPCPM